MTGRAAKSGVKTISCWNCCRDEGAPIAPSKETSRSISTAQVRVKPASNRKGELLPARTVVAQAPAQPAFDEWVQLTIQDCLGVADLDTGAHVLHLLVGLQHVVADLRAELGRHHISAQFLTSLCGPLLPAP